MPHPRTPTLQLSATRLDLAASGIGRVGRLMARVIADEVAAGRIAARLLSLSPGPRQLFGLHVRSARDVQPAFLALNALAAWKAQCFLYDFAGAARAHPPKLLAAPYLTWMHGIDVWEKARRDHLARLRAADILLVNSQYTLERARKLHRGLERAQVCWLATETDDPAAPALDDHPPSVMILGRIDASEAYKGHRELIEAWPTVRKHVPDAQLLIAGEGSGREALQRLARRVAPDSGIQFLGFVPDAGLPGLFRRADVLAMPSRGEGFGLTYIEAMRCGVPVVASIHDAAPEINVHGVTGLNVDLTDARALPAALSDLLNDRSHARGLGEAGRARWAEHFSYTRFRMRFAQHLQALLDRV